MNFGGFFLKEPGRFPAEPMGVPWGEEVVDLAMSGSCFTFTGLSPRQAAYVRQRYGDFLGAPSDGDTPAVPTQLFRAAAEDFRSFAQRGWTYTLDRDYGPNRVRIAGLDLMALLDWSPHLSAALWSATVACSGKWTSSSATTPGWWWPKWSWKAPTSRSTSRIGPVWK